MKKIVCMICVIALLCSMSITGFAADTTAQSGTVNVGTEAGGTENGTQPAGTEAGDTESGTTSPGTEAGGTESGTASAGTETGGMESGTASASTEAGSTGNGTQSAPNKAPALQSAPEAPTVMGTMVSRGIVGKITESLSGRAKELLETQLVLALEDLSGEGSEFAGGLLFFFYNATDYTINEIYKTVLETLEIVNEIDDEVDALTVRVEELFDEIEKGFAQSAYDDCAEDLDAVYTRLAPLWEEYTQIIAATSDTLPADQRLTQQQLEQRTDELMKRVYDTYGPGNNGVSFESDLALVHNAMYSPSGRTTFTDAQIALSRLNLPFEHQTVDEASAAFNYGASLQTALLWLYAEYANYMQDPEHPERMQGGSLPFYVPDVQVYRFVTVGNETYRNLNAQAEHSGINELMKPEEIETSITLSDGTVLPVYHVIVNADGHEYMIGRETLLFRDTVQESFGGGEHYYKAVHIDKLTSADGRWYIPATESEMKTLFTPTITNPGSWLSDSGGLSLPSHDALLLADISNKSESHLNGVSKDYYYSFDQGMLDSHRLTGDQDKVTVNSYHDMDKSVQWAGRSEEIPYRETELLYVFFDKSNQVAGIPKDDNGFLAPSDPTTLPDEIYLGDGDGLNLTKLNSTDLLNKIVIVSGDAAILGGGRTYQNLQIQMKEGANLTVDSLNIDHKNTDKAAIDVYASDTKLTVRGECSFNGGAGIYMDQDSAIDVVGDGAGSSVTLSGKWGINAKDGGYENFYKVSMTFSGLTVSVQGTQYGVRGASHIDFTDCDVSIGGDQYDLYGGTSIAYYYFYDCRVTLAHNTKETAQVKISESTEINTPIRYHFELSTSSVKNAQSDSDIYLYLTGKDRNGNTVTTNGVNITDCVDGKKFTNNSWDEFDADFDTYLTYIDYITLVNKGSDAWYPAWIEITNSYELPNPETGKECYYHFNVNMFIDTKNYEYRFTHDGKRNAPTTVGSAQPLSDEDLIAMLENTLGAGTLQTMVGSGHTVSAQVLAALKRLGQSLQYAVTDADGNLLYRWIFDGTKITDPSLLTRLGITISKTQEDTYGGLLAGKDGLVLRFAHDGLLPGETQVHINAAGYGYTDDAIFTLYHIDGNKLTEVESGLTMQQDGFVPIRISHCSDYALIKTGEQTNPKTGDSASVLPWIFAMAAACAGMFAAGKIRKGMRV